MPSVPGPTTGVIFFDRKENEAKETLYYYCGVDTTLFMSAVILVVRRLVEAEIVYARLMQPFALLRRH